jgi:hypothetical protein
MNEFLEAKHISTKPLTNSLFQIDDINEDTLDELLDNYDIIQQVQSLRYMHTHPDRYGNPQFDIALDLTLREGSPTIGIIDTGIESVETLQPILADDGIDITNIEVPSPYHVYVDHGTTVATLASFGNAYFHTHSTDILADAKVFSIKIQNDEVGCINLAGIQKAIQEANTNYGIRIFNLSMAAGCKNYNSDISIYAYLLDRLAYEMDILIFISTGNLDRQDIQQIEAKKRDPNIDNSTREFLEYPHHFYDPSIETDVHVCECMNISEPAESMNNMTVGALADNLNDDSHTDLSLGKQFPAYYSRKYYLDYNQKINNTPFNKNQKNSNLFKPDIVMPGGDELERISKMQLLGLKLGSLDYIFNAGTSYATPLAANIAAKIVRLYPHLRMQTIKALIINSATEVDTTYLEGLIEMLKTKENPSYPDVGSNEKRRLSSMYSPKLLGHYISGYGKPDIERCLFSNEKRVTFVIEDTIQFDSHKVVNINIPIYLFNHPNKRKALSINATLCYNFDPVFGNAMSYNPLHISFNIGNSMNHDDPQANAIEYSDKRAKDNNERMAIKTKFPSWSDDFFPANTKLFSNVQKMELSLKANDLMRINGQMAIIFRCTGRDTLTFFEQLKAAVHKFSFILTIEEMPSIELAEKNLHDEIQLNNTVENIASLNADIALDL